MQVTFYLDEPFLIYYCKWLKYYPALETWDSTYTAHIVDGIGTNVVTLEFKDGGFGDIDGLENGVIVDPSGPAIVEITGGSSDNEESNKWCFIATAAYGIPIAEEVIVLRQFRNEYLLTNPIGKVFVDTYYKISPSISGFIRQHPVLKKMMRESLKPLIWISRKVG